MVTTSGPAAGTDLDAVRAAVAAVVDPEIRVVTIEDLGILRDVAVAADGRVTVTITPTYSGCPAMDVIRQDVTAAVRGTGHDDVDIRTVLSPAWSTDRISMAGRSKLRAAGIAPPGPAGSDRGTRVGLGMPVTRSAVPCPRCGSRQTQELSRFGSTTCKSLWRCLACTEPFDHVKAH